MRDGLVQEGPAGFVYPAMGSHWSGFKLGIGKQIVVPIPIGLDVTSIGHALLNGRGPFRDVIVPQVGDGHRRDFDVNIKSVPERAGQPAPIAPDLLRRTDTVSRSVAVMPARAGVHGDDQHESRRISKGGVDSRHGYGSVFERLS